MANVVLVEDEMLLRRSIRRHLEHAGHRVADTDSIVSAIGLAHDLEADVVITDLSLGNENGLDLIHQLRGDGFEGGIIIITAHGSVAGAVQGIKQGADEYLQKPISLQELQRLVARTIDDRLVRRRLHLYQRIEQVLETTPPLLGDNERWTATIESARRLAALPSVSSTGISCILISGETGTGKRSLGRFIHSQSPAREGPFVHIRCFALPAQVLESELFGHDSGASSHSGQFRPGLFELASGGTVFFEEIAEMPEALQTKLLAVLEQGIAMRLGSQRQMRVHVQIIASTSQCLDERTRNGSFRSDLYYRLAEMSLSVPPLRERSDDIMLLAEGFLSVVRREFGRPNLRFGREAASALRSHNWPGNVRELQSVVRRAAALAVRDEITPADVGMQPESVSPGAGRPESIRAQSRKLVVNSPDHLEFEFTNGPIRLEEVEKKLIIAALKSSRGNISRASKLMNMTRSALRYRIDRYRLDEMVREMNSG